VCQIRKWRKIGLHRPEPGPLLGIVRGAERNVISTCKEFAFHSRYLCTLSLAKIEVRMKVSEPL
jgi:hypothetical protein